ncbi:LysR family transcriptional regulator [Vibrio mangrovi]|uniref:HTH-type transcriptional regulator DmlR n=1 Tax=Vibrio mangrovi TaxID=474394 RepID=A0A1Y6IYD3_9VIBR|nr:LysR family transcriptional regulator [Vibrio mangrovi]MDW6005164.1 LysR family transcriptional regulator [Vibrio mangrovi]SMS02626.1 HTH-type transcriptional regulator DmlR [Vibrio mangrovi]
MNKNYNDLLAFVTVAREGSFTKAAGLLGVSQSALSHTVKGLEERLDVRLLNRTTRSVSPTEAGERLLQSIAPKLEDIDRELELINEFKLRPAGTIRITAAEHAANTFLWPKVRQLLLEYPDISVEISVNYGFVDIVAERFDAGIRLGENLDKDMIAVPISPPLRMAVVATPEYWQKRQKPTIPHELVEHNCINIRLPTYGGMYVWEFEKDGKEINVNVKGQVVMTSSIGRLDAALSGLGISYVPEDLVEEHIKQGRLERVLEDWCLPFDGYYLYYPNRQLSSPAFRLLVDALRYHRR